MKNLAILFKKPFIAPPPTYDETFGDDIIELFSGTQSGHVGKYIYTDDTPSAKISDDHDYLWSDIIKQNNPSYYMPKADNTLLQKANDVLCSYIPFNTSVVDFGVGGLIAFKQHIVPVLKNLKSATYYGVDICKEYLDAVYKLSPPICESKIVPVHMDFFNPDRRTISNSPTLGIMTCGTIGNITASIKDSLVEANLTHNLRVISRLTCKGWLLISIDTNQDKRSLMAGYATALMENLFLNVFHRAAKELPMVGFDPSLFRYTPEWIPENQLFAHIAEATESQDFQLGEYKLQVQKGQKLHLLNSYKFSAPFFESCCDKANLDVLQVWDHESPMKLYLLKDRANTL